MYTILPWYKRCDPANILLSTTSLLASFLALTSWTCLLEADDMWISDYEQKSQKSKKGSIIAICWETFASGNNSGNMRLIGMWPFWYRRFSRDNRGLHWETSTPRESRSSLRELSYTLAIFSIFTHLSINSLPFPNLISLVSETKKSAWVLPKKSVPVLMPFSLAHETTSFAAATTLWKTVYCRRMAEQSLLQHRSTNGQKADRKRTSENWTGPSVAYEEAVRCYSIASLGKSIDDLSALILASETDSYSFRMMSTVSISKVSDTMTVTSFVYAATALPCPGLKEVSLSCLNFSGTDRLMIR